MPGEFDRALGAALGRLKARERFSGEMRAWLLAKGYEQVAVDQVLEHLIRRNLLSDERATEALSRRRSGKRAVGLDRLKAEIAAKGGAPESLPEGADETERALEALGARRSWKSAAQAARFLAGRGFDEEAIRQAIERLAEEI